MHDETSGTATLGLPSEVYEPEHAAAVESRYETLEVLGRGGMGEVLLVRDRRAGRSVALKRSKGGTTADPGVRARFFREAGLHARLEHPNIVPVYDTGTDAEGVPYFTMRRVHGHTLAEVLRDAREGKQPASQRRLLTALRQVCLALHYAHEHGVVHRDVKPSNIMLGAYGEVYLLDWGIALDTAEAATAGQGAERHAAEAGGFQGSLVTMSPEQARGDAVDARSDVYAIGAMLFEILTLTPLHPRGSKEEVVSAILAGVDARPSVRCPAVEIAPELETLCVASTALDPAVRTPSALALSQALDAYLDGDRDLEARARAAAQHAAAAQSAAARALSGAAPEARESALRELGKALALRPNDPESVALLAQLLTTPPERTPDEVSRESGEVRRASLRNSGLVAAGLYAFGVLYGIFTRSVSHAPGDQLVVAAAYGVAVIAALTLAWRKTYGALFVCHLAGLLASCSLTVLLGPFVVFVPMLLVLHSSLYSFADSPMLRRGVAATSVAAWSLCVFGADVGLLPRRVFYESGQLIVRSDAIAFSPTVTPAFFYIGITFVLVASSLMTGRMRRALTAADAELRVQGWQLARLAGDAARPGATERSG